MAVYDTNIDIRCLVEFFSSTIPITVDFVEHVHYKNIDQLKYVLARTIVLLHQEHRTGYRRCLLQFLKDLIALPQAVQKLFLQNFNCLCAVDIELWHGMLASVCYPDFDTCTDRSPQPYLTLTFIRSSQMFTKRAVNSEP